MMMSTDVMIMPYITLHGTQNFHPSNGIHLQEESSVSNREREKNERRPNSSLSSLRKRRGFLRTTNDEQTRMKKAPSTLMVRNS